MAGPIQEAGTAQAVRDNNTNLLTEEHLPSAINRVLASPVQSYDQFMDSFLYLRKEDVQEYIPGLEDYPEWVQNGPEPPDERSPPEAPPGTVMDNRGNSTWDKECNIDDLETEELGEGVSSLITPRHVSPPGQRFVKVDNFLDDSHLSSDSESDDSLSDDITDLLDGIVPPDDVTPVKLTVKMKEDITEDKSEKDHVCGQLPTPLPGEVHDGTAVFLQPEMKAVETRLAVGSPDIAHASSAAVKGIEPQTDKVQPFILDPDFDYDNVKLTPKWGDDIHMLCKNAVLNPT